jgi:steroid 5-alpha reductase family enzyme
MASKRNVRYKALSTEDQDEYDDANDDGKDLRFSYMPKKYNRIPWKSIALAIFLLLLGTLLLVLSYFIHTGHMPGDSSQANGLLFLGILAFLPGMHL